MIPPGFIEDPPNSNLYITAPATGYGPSTRTVADVMKAVKRTFGDESGVQLEDGDIIMWVNDAQEEIVNRNRNLKGTATISTVASQRDYTFPVVPILSTDSLHYDGAVLPNLPFAQAEQDYITNPSYNDVGEPECWYEWGGIFSLYPAPNKVALITLYLTLRPTRVTATANLLSIPDKYYQDIVKYVLGKAYEMDEDWAANQATLQGFDASVSMKNDEERTAANMSFGIVRDVD